VVVRNDACVVHDGHSYQLPPTVIGRAGTLHPLKDRVRVVTGSPSPRAARRPVLLQPPSPSSSPMKAERSGAMATMTEAGALSGPPDPESEPHARSAEVAGRGKTHLATAIAYRALQNGFAALFTTCAALVDDLSSAAANKRSFREALLRYTSPDVLVVDDVGYLTYSNDAANALFHVVNDRHLKKRSMLFTTNKSISSWGALLHDEDLAQAILDRVFERGRHIKLDGPSIRTLHLDGGLPTEENQQARVSGTPGPEFSEPTRTIGADKDGSVWMRDWNDLQTFAAVVRAGSIAAAAKGLGVHPTTVARRLASAEKSLGAPLLLRSGRRLTLSPRGQQLQTAIEPLFELVEQVARRAGHVAKPIRIAVTENGARLVARQLAAVLVDAQLDVEIIGGNAVVDLARGDADFAIRVITPEHPDFIRRRIGAVTYGLFASATYLKRRAHFEHGWASHHILMPSGELSKGPEASFLALHATDARIVLRANSHVALAHAAEASLGLVVSPMNLAYFHPELVCVRPLPEIPARPIWLVMHQSFRADARLRRAAAIVTEGLQAFERHCTGPRLTHDAATRPPSERGLAPAASKRASAAPPLDREKSASPERERHAPARTKKKKRRVVTKSASARAKT
jgi:DNA-binding transcriptional LysR family regulator